MKLFAAALLRVSVGCRRAAIRLRGAWQSRHRARRGRHGPELRRAALERPAEPSAPARSGRADAPGYHHAAAESGGLGDVHHRHRPGAARHLRFRAPRPIHPAAGFIDGGDHRAGASARHRALSAAALESARAIVSLRPDVLGDPGPARDSGDHDPHAHQLSAHRARRPRAGRDGHAGSRGHVRHVHLLHRRPVRAWRRGAGRPYRACSSCRPSRRAAASTAPPIRCAATIAPCAWRWWPTWIRMRRPRASRSASSSSF